MNQSQRKKEGVLHVAKLHTFLTPWIDGERRRLLKRLFTASLELLSFISGDGPMKSAGILLLHVAVFKVGFE